MATDLMCCGEELRGVIMDIPGNGTSVLEIYLPGDIVMVVLCWMLCFSHSLNVEMFFVFFVLFCFVF